jgi:hypothetical protein
LIFGPELGAAGAGSTIGARAFVMSSGLSRIFQAV